MEVFKSLDKIIFILVLPLLSFGLVTMYSFTDQSYFFQRQVIWASFSLLLLFFLPSIDWRFLKRSTVLLFLYVFFLILLAILLFFGESVRGAQSWFSLGGFTFQPSDFMKLILILVLAKYFSRRHVQIGHIQHIIVSSIYVLIPIFLVLLQPDFGTALILFLIWLGMIMVSGVSKKHLFLVFLLASLSFGILWGFVFTDPQKARIISFIRPLEDIQGTGYNAYQSTIAVGSGELFGKGVGYGTQSRLEFLPEYQTDFIFAAFAEEWGFIGVCILFLLFGLLFWRILQGAFYGDTNFETLFGFGITIMFMSHFLIHVGMNIGLLPVTGLPIPFLSYGGSHLLVEFLALGILMGMKRYNRTVHREIVSQGEIVGVSLYEL